MKQPDWIPSWATNVQVLPGKLWVWEFSGGASLCMAYEDGRGDQGTSLWMDHETLDVFLRCICPEERRYQAAIAAERARIASYEAYLANDWKGDDDDD